MYNETRFSDFKMKLTSRTIQMLMCVLVLVWTVHTNTYTCMYIYTIIKALNVTMQQID